MKKFSLIYQGDVHPSSDDKIIPAESFTQLLEASEIIEKAREDSEKLLKKTKEKCKKLREDAKEKGKEEGLEAFNEQIVVMDKEMKAVRHKLQQMILPLALKAAKKIVAKELDTFPETIVDIVVQAIMPISESHKVTIFVSKEEKELLEKNKPRLKELLPNCELLTIQERSDVTPGGCIIQTEHGMLNASIENQWASLERAFAKYVQSPDNPNQ